MHGRIQFWEPHASQRPPKLYIMDQREYNLAPGQPASTLVRVYSVYVYIYIYNTLLFYFIWIELCRAHPWPKTKSKYVTNETLLIYRLHWSLLASSTSASSSSSTSSWIEKRTLRTSSNPPRCGAQKTTEELSILREYVIILPSHLLFFVFLLCT